MRAFHVLSVAAALAFASVSAHATLVNVQYNGAVVGVDDPTAAFGFKIGDLVHYSINFDPAKLTNVSASFYNIDAITGLPVEIPGLQTASLSDDAAYTATVTIGAYTFSKFDELGYGKDPLGAGRLPFVVYDGSTFLGTVLDVASPGGFELDTDPIAKILHYFPTEAVSFNDNSENFNFGLLVDVDAADAVFTPVAVPEPASWALMTLGFGVCGGAIRARRERKFGLIAL